MMYNYKIVIYGSGIYQEIPLTESDEGTFKIGTHKNCDVRFDKESFFDEIEISFVKCEEGWRVNCSNNIYIDVDGVVKFHSLVLNHGDNFTLKYKKSKAEIFKMSYLIDFDIQDFNFDRAIEIGGKQQITIGGIQGCDIYISNPIASGDTVTLVAGQGYYNIIDNNSRNGVYINGSKMTGNSGVVKDRDFFMLDGTDDTIEEIKETVKIVKNIGKTVKDIPDKGVFSVTNFVDDKDVYSAGYQISDKAYNYFDSTSEIVTDDLQENGVISESARNTFNNVVDYGRFIKDLYGDNKKMTDIIGEGGFSIFDKFLIAEGNVHETISYFTDLSDN